MAIVACVLAIGVAALSSAAVESPAPRLVLKPARYAQEIEPGFSSEVEVEARNETTRTLRLRFAAVDLEAGTGESFATAARGQVERSALDWLSFDRSEQVLRPGETIAMDVVIDVPDDAAPGAYAFAIVATQVFAPIGTTNADAIGSRVEVRANLGSTFVIVVPGEAPASAKLVSHEAPRLVWRDEEPTFEAIVENDGQTLLKLEAATELSSFGAFATRTLRSAERPTLPGGRRALAMRWSDRPWIGWFTPRLVVVGGEGSGVRVEKQLPTVFVLPPWWVLVLLLVAVAIPVRAGVQRRRRIRDHRARLRAARIADDEYDGA